METQNIMADKWPGKIDDDKPSIYVACLASYNSGILHGRWITPSSDEETLQNQINQILKSSSIPDAEEWAVHDYNNFYNLGEYPGLKKICELAEAYEAQNNDYLKVNGYIEHFGIEALSNLEDAFYGEYSSFDDFANNYADETIPELQDGTTIARYFDYESFSQDLGFDFVETEAPGGNVYIWRNF